MEWDGKVVTFKKIRHTILTESTFNDVHPGMSLPSNCVQIVHIHWAALAGLWCLVMALLLQCLCVFRKGFYITTSPWWKTKLYNTEKPCFGDFCHSKSAMIAIMWDRGKLKEQMKMVIWEHIQITNPFTGFEVWVWLWANKSREWGWASLRHHLTGTPECIWPLRMSIFQLTLVGLTRD